MIANLFDIEKMIKDKVVADGVFSADLVYFVQDERFLDNKAFTGLPSDDDKNALLICYEGFDVDKVKSGKTQKLLLRYRTIVVSPDGLHFNNAGAKFVETIHSIRDIEDCLDVQLVTDIHGFHAPSYTNNMIAVPLVWQFTVTT